MSLTNPMGSSSSYILTSLSEVAWAEKNSMQSQSSVNGLKKLAHVLAALRSKVLAYCHQHDWFRRKRRIPPNVSPASLKKSFILCHLVGCCNSVTTSAEGLHSKDKKLLFYSRVALKTKVNVLRR